MSIFDIRPPLRPSRNVASLGPRTVGQGCLPQCTCACRVHRYNSRRGFAVSIVYMRSSEGLIEARRASELVLAVVRSPLKLHRSVFPCQFNCVPKIDRSTTWVVANFQHRPYTLSSTSSLRDDGCGGDILSSTTASPTGRSSNKLSNGSAIMTCRSASCC